MKRLLLFFVLSLVFCLGIQSQRLQHSSAFLKAYEKTAVLMPFSVSALPDVAGDATKVSWGMDTAWDSADNVTRGTNYIGKGDSSCPVCSVSASYCHPETAPAPGEGGEGGTTGGGESSGTTTGGGESGGTTTGGGESGGTTGGSESGGTTTGGGEGGETPTPSIE